MSRRSDIIAKLTSVFEPDMLEVTDESESHRGHGGWREGGETHFHVRIAASQFDGKPLVAAHREINAALADEFDAGLHALSIKIVRPAKD